MSSPPWPPSRVQRKRAISAKPFSMRMRPSRTSISKVSLVASRERDRPGAAARLRWHELYVEDLQFDYGTTEIGPPPWCSARSTEPLLRAATMASAPFIRSTRITRRPPVVHDFGSHYDDGQSPRSLVEAASGQLIGFTAYGGYLNQGVVFAYESGSGVNTVLGLDSSTGVYPAASPVLASDGHIYGTLTSGGANGHGGTLYRMARSIACSSTSPPTPSVSTCCMMYDFGGPGSPGCSPQSRL
jgi:hypothetical protein